jgi:hypothetical protein
MKIDINKNLSKKTYLSTAVIAMAIEELEELNQSFRERGKMKDDAIAHLSDQLMALTVRMQDLERNR